MQVFSFVEAQKRTTTGTGDAQTSGIMAMHTLLRDIRHAGYGINAHNILGCELDLGGGKMLPILTHVVINPVNIPAGDANTDILLITYGNAGGATQGEVIISAGGSLYTMPSGLTYKQGDRVVETLAAPGTAACSLKLNTVTSVSGNNYTVSAPIGTAVSSESALFNLGDAPKVLAYAIRAGNLTLCDYMASNCTEGCTAADGSCNPAWIPVANNIVSLRAQYGRDATSPMDGTVDVWDQLTPIQFSPPNQTEYACLWVRVPAVRLAVVARNAQTEKEAVTPASPTWYGSATHPIMLQGTRSNWQHYRYRLFQTVVPIRNMPWILQCDH
jgi:type IV pilus assembly protein PilW